MGYAEVAEASVDDPVRAATYIREIYRAGERAASLTAQLLAFARKQIIEPKVIDMNKLVTELNHLLSRIIGEHINLVSKTSKEAVRAKADYGQRVLPTLLAATQIGNMYCASLYGTFASLLSNVPADQLVCKEITFLFYFILIIYLINFKFLNY